MHELPSVRAFEFCDPPEGDVLEFRLLFKGPLPADTGTGNRAKYKHQIRKDLHKQLKELWNQHPSLRLQAETLWRKEKRREDGSWWVREVDIPKEAVPSMYPSAKTWVEHIADDHPRLDTRWVPLVSKVSGFTCSLDILFLRRDNPGGLIAHGGDIDNRIKTFLDGLKIPDTISDLGGFPIEADENPFYCLLEDDRLITGITVTTDRLLLPLGEAEKQTFVELIVDVKIIDQHALFAGGRLV